MCEVMPNLIQKKYPMLKLDSQPLPQTSSGESQTYKIAKLVK